MTVVLATTNKGKIREINALFAGTGITFIAPGESYEVIEDGATFHENARKKALHVHRMAGMATVAEDSGLEVKELGGAPGIYSARFAGENARDRDNLEKLLGLLAGMPAARRKARFVCVFCLVEEDGKEHYFEGEVQGTIATAPTGSSGFGYDPLFVPEGYGKTFAELGEEVKNGISHRARGAGKLKDFLVNTTKPESMA